MLRWICFWSILARQPLIKSKKTRRWRWRRWWGWSAAPWGSSPASPSSAGSRSSTMPPSSYCPLSLRRWDTNAWSYIEAGIPFQSIYFSLIKREVQQWWQNQPGRRRHHALCFGGWSVTGSSSPLYFAAVFFADKPWLRMTYQCISCAPNLENNQHRICFLQRKKFWNHGMTQFICLLCEQNLNTMITSSHECILRSDFDF